MLTVESKVLSKFMKKLRTTVKEFEKDMLSTLEDQPDDWEGLTEDGLWEVFAGYCRTEEE